MVAVAVSIASRWLGRSGHALKCPQDGDSSSEGMNGTPRASAIFCSGAWFAVES